MSNQNKFLYSILLLMVLVIGFYVSVYGKIEDNVITPLKGKNAVINCYIGTNSAFNNVIKSFNVNVDEHGYSDDYCKITGSKVYYTAKLDYPTAGRLFTINVNNYGNPFAIEIGPNSKTKAVYYLKVYNENDNVLNKKLTDRIDDVGREQAVWNNGTVAYSIIESSGIICSGTDHCMKKHTMIDKNNKKYISIKKGETLSVITQMYWDETYSDAEWQGYYFISEATLNFDFIKIKSDMKNMD